MMRPCRQAYLLALNYYNIKLKSCTDRNLQTQSNEKIDNIKLCVKNAYVRSNTQVCDFVYIAQTRTERR